MTRKLRRGLVSETKSAPRVGAAVPARSEPTGSSACEREGDILRVLCTHGHLLRLAAELLVPRFECVRSRSQPGQRDAAVRGGDAEERMIEHADPRVHPCMHIAAERNHHLTC